MADIKKTGKEIESKVTSFLAGKPLWIYLVFYVLVTGVLFLLFWLISKLFLGQWLVTVILIVVIGIVWGAITYSAQARKTVKAKPAAPAKKKKK